MRLMSGRVTGMAGRRRGGTTMTARTVNRREALERLFAPGGFDSVKLTRAPDGPPGEVGAASSRRREDLQAIERGEDEGMIVEG